MNLNLPHAVMRSLSKDYNEIAEFFEEKGMQNRTFLRDDSITSERIPVLYLKIIAKEWQAVVDSYTPESLKESSDQRGYAARLAEFTEELKITTAKSKAKPRNLKELSFKLKSILEERLGERCWVYSERGEPFIVKSVEYQPPGTRDRGAYLLIHLARNYQGGFSTKTFTIDTEMFKSYKRDPVAILESFGITFETEELYANYVANLADWRIKSKWQSNQVVDALGKKYICDNHHHEELDVKVDRFGDFSRKSKRPLDFTSSSFNLEKEIVEVPNKLEIFVFSLTEHKHLWIASAGMTDYVYDKDVSKKLILPEDHKDLIDILLSDDVQNIGADIIANKGLNTVILTKGGPGLGKTVTAEIYSESKELPLYSVHSGQLGIDGEKIEEKLRGIFANAERWGCILLLDEADVYIRKRDNGINHNAMVATFLRTMEYFNGTLFMTTNRSDDVDEAIESRCTAVLRYELPGDDMSAKLWKLFCSQFNVTVSDDVLSDIAKALPKLSGRDIKNIVMLVSRYSIGKEIDKPGVEVFKTCATFRGKYAVS